jgi:hypothetical protein
MHTETPTPPQPAPANTNKYISMYSIILSWVYTNYKQHRVNLNTPVSLLPLVWVRLCQGESVHVHTRPGTVGTGISVVSSSSLSVYCRLR